MGAREGVRLAVRDRLLLHLSDHPVGEKDYDVPVEVTQEGLAVAAEVQQRHVPQYLRPLIGAGLVEQRVAHVRGRRQRRKAYLLTGDGRSEALRLRGKLLAVVVEVEGTDGSLQSATLGSVLKGEAHGVPLLQLLQRVAPHGRMLPPRAPEQAPPTTVEMLSGAPRPQYFLGRQAELGEITGETLLPRVFVVRGVPGIGKTTLGSMACELLRGHRNLFWHRVRPWDTRQSVLVALGEFLGALGRPGLRASLKKGDAGTAASLLRLDLHGTRSFLVFDDAHEGSREVLGLMKYMKEVVEGAEDSKVLVLTRRSLTFYDRRDVVITGLVREMELGGLPLEDVASLLSAEQQGAAIAAAHRDLGGHPLFLQLMRSSSHAHTLEALRDQRHFIQETVYAELTDEERRVMKVASLFGVAVPREALLVEGRTTPETLLALVDRSLLMPVGDDALEVHDTIRDFFSAMLSPSEVGGHATRVYNRLRLLATDAEARGDRVGCMAYLANAVRRAPTPENAWTAWEGLGKVQHSMGDLPGALVAYREGLRMAPERRTEARLHRRMASTLAAMGEHAAAEAEARGALDALGEEADEEKAWVALVRCRVATEQERWDGAKDQGRAAVQAFRSLGIREGEADALLALGDVELDSPLGSPALAEENFTGALALAEDLGQVEFIARAHNALAHLSAYRRGDVESTERHIAAIEALPGALEDLHMRRSFLMLKGWFTLELLADYSRARALFTEAGVLARRIHDAQTLLISRYALALTSFLEDKLPEARGELETIAKDLLAKGFLGFAAEATLAAAEISLGMGDIEGFRRFLVRTESPAMGAGAEARPIQLRVLQGLDLLMRGDVEGMHREMAEALTSAAQTVPVQDWPQAYFVHYFYGAAMEAIGEKAQAEGHFSLSFEGLRAHHLMARLKIAQRYRSVHPSILRRAMGPP